MSNNKDCLFCKIINGDVDVAKIYEDEYSIAYLDVNPISKGHAIILPKEHVKSIHDTDTDIVDIILDTVTKVTIAVNKAFSPERIETMNNSMMTLKLFLGRNGGMTRNKKAEEKARINAFAPSGQTIFHVHIHLIPRYKPNFGNKTIFSNDFEDLQRYAEEIKKYM